jgi:creatinine amidohydrolase
MASPYRYEEMFPQQFLRAVEEMPVFIIPTGLLEWHGDHLPLGLDALKAHAVCLRIAEKLGGSIVLPPNYFGRPGYSRYVGTLTFSEACMQLLFTELFEQLQKVGAKVIALITGHYGPCQVNFIKKAAELYMIEHPEITIIAQPEYEDVEIDGESPQDHAGKYETSMFSYLYPELTRMDRFELQTSRKMLYSHPPHDYYKEEEEWVWGEDLTQAASPELGERCVEIITSHIAETIQQALVNRRLSRVH